MKPEELDIKDSRIFFRSNPARSFPFNQVSGKDTAATFTGRPPLSLWSLGMGKMLDTMNALFCEVAVDTETGEVEVLSHVIVADPGQGAESAGKGMRMVPRFPLPVARCAFPDKCNSFLTGNGTLAVPNITADTQF
jgi:hypothetical protein